MERWEKVNRKGSEAAEPRRGSAFGALGLLASRAQGAWGLGLGSVRFAHAGGARFASAGAWGLGLGAWSYLERGKV